MTITEMKERKKELGYTNEQLSSLSGVPLGTVQKILAGITKAPRRDTILALEKVLNCSETGKHGSSEAHMVRETSAYYGGTSAYKFSEQRRYTIDDYYALPDERKVELIDGVFYDMAAPGQMHQALLGQLFLHFSGCMDRHPECELFFAPLDVRLDHDEYTMVQPDLLIVCGREDHDTRRINGAPDFVAEILSPSNRYHDLVRKLGKYGNAGVREYWIVDPQRQKVIVYDLEHDDFPIIYTFEDTIPVLISGGECSIDFATIREKTKRYLS